MESNSEHFSLDSFLRDAVKFYLSGWKTIKNGILTYWKFSLLLLCFIASVFFFKALNTHTYFEGTTSYIKHYSHVKIYGDKLFDLEKLIEINEAESVAQVLNIDKSIAEKIVYLHAKNIKGSPLNEDLTNMEVPFYIDIKLTNKDSLTIIQDAITRYLKSGKFISNHVLSENKQLQKELELVTKEYNFLDSLKENYTKGKSEEIGTLFAYSKEKFNQKKRLEEKVAKTQAVSVLKPFSVVRISKSSLLKKKGLKYGLAFIFISLFLTTFLYWYHNPSDES